MAGFCNMGMASMPPSRTRAEANHQHPQTQLFLRARCERKDVIGGGVSKPQAAANLPRAGKVRGGDPTKNRSLCGVCLHCSLEQVTTSRLERQEAHTLLQVL